MGLGKLIKKAKKSAKKVESTVMKGVNQAKSLMSSDLGKQLVNAGLSAAGVSDANGLLNKIGLSNDVISKAKKGLNTIKQLKDGNVNIGALDQSGIIDGVKNTLDAIKNKKNAL